MFRLEHFDDMFRLEHSRCFHQPCTKPEPPAAISAQCSNRNIRTEFPPQRANDKPLECSGWNIGHVLHINQPTHGNSTLHSKRESHYSANSSGFSTIYGTRHRCCQSEGRRG